MNNLILEELNRYRQLMGLNEAPIQPVLKRIKDLIVRRVIGDANQEVITNYIKKAIKKNAKELSEVQGKKYATDADFKKTIDDIVDSANFNNLTDSEKTVLRDDLLEYSYKEYEEALSKKIGGEVIQTTTERKITENDLKTKSGILNAIINWLIKTEKGDLSKRNIIIRYWKKTPNWKKFIFPLIPWIYAEYQQGSGQEMYESVVSQYCKGGPVFPGKKLSPDLLNQYATQITKAMNAPLFGWEAVPGFIGGYSIGRSVEFEGTTGLISSINQIGDSGGNIHDFCYIRGGMGKSQEIFDDQILRITSTSAELDQLRDAIVGLAGDAVTQNTDTTTTESIVKDLDWWKKKFPCMSENMVSASDESVKIIYTYTENGENKTIKGDVFENSTVTWTEGGTGNHKFKCAGTSIEWVI